MSKKQALVSAFPVLLLVSLLGCSRAPSQTTSQTPGTSAGVLEVRLVPETQIEARTNVAAEIMPVLEALFWGGIEDRRAVVQYISVACTTADGLGGPPKCPPGKAEGTLVEVFPVGGAEGHFVNDEEIEGTLAALQVSGLYAVYQPEPGRDPVEYWPVGEYALIFDREMLNASMPVTVFVQDGKMVRVGFTPTPMVDPAELLKEVPLDRILITPQEAKALTEEVRRPR